MVGRVLQSGQVWWLSKQVTLETHCLQCWVRLKNMAYRRLLRLWGSVRLTFEQLHGVDGTEIQRPVKDVWESNQSKANYQQ